MVRGNDDYANVALFVGWFGISMKVLKCSRSLVLGNDLGLLMDYFYFLLAVSRYPHFGVLICGVGGIKLLLERKLNVVTVIQKHTQVTVYHVLDKRKHILK